jgi:hypothetical protein
MVARVGERGAKSRVLVAGVENPARAGRYGSLDADAEQRRPVGGRIV